MQNRFQISFSTVVSFLLIVFIGASSTLTGQSTNSDSKGTKRPPLINATVKVTNTCKSGNTCSNWLNSMKKVNAIKITNLSYSWYPSLQFTIYPCPGPNPGCTSVATFACNQSVITYASTLLANGGSFYIVLKDTQSNNSVGYNFTNGSFNGKICGSGETTGPK